MLRQLYRPLLCQLTTSSIFVAFTTYIHGGWMITTVLASKCIPASQRTMMILLPCGICTALGPIYGFHHNNMKHIFQMFMEPDSKKGVRV